MTNKVLRGLVGRLSACQEYSKAALRNFVFFSNYPPQMSVTNTKLITDKCLGHVDASADVFASQYSFDITPFQAIDNKDFPQTAGIP